MAKRFFKAQLGDKIYFRASGTKVYQSVIDGRYGVGFSSTVANGIGVNDAPAVQIDKAEYNRLVALKNARLKAAGNWRNNAPSDSWVLASEVAA